MRRTVSTFQTKFTCKDSLIGIGSRPFPHHFHVLFGHSLGAILVINASKEERIESDRGGQPRVCVGVPERVDLPSNTRQVVELILEKFVACDCWNWQLVRVIGH